MDEGDAGQALRGIQHFTKMWGEVKEGNFSVRAGRTHRHKHKHKMRA